MDLQTIQIPQEKSDISLSFHMKYNLEELKVFQFLAAQFHLVPKIVFHWKNRYLIFIETSEYEHFRPLSRQISRFFGLGIHFRLISFSQQLSEFIQSWYFNLRHVLGINLNFDETANIIKIVLDAPANLRQFIIGKGGQELEMLASFLNSCVVGNYKYQIAINIK